MPCTPQSHACMHVRACTCMGCPMAAACHVSCHAHPPEPKVDATTVAVAYPTSHIPIWKPSSTHQRIAHTATLHQSNDSRCTHNQLSGCIREPLCSQSSSSMKTAQQPPHAQLICHWTGCLASSTRATAVQLLSAHYFAVHCFPCLADPLQA